MSQAAEKRHANPAILKDAAFAMGGPARHRERVDRRRAHGARQHARLRARALDAQYCRGLRARKILSGR